MRLLLAMGFVFAAAVHAAIDPYEFETETQRERYRHFIEEMRCPKCQNQNLAGSDAPIAKDLRQELHRLLSEGRSDTEIVDYMVARYGEYILYKPPFDAKTAWLWIAPAGFLLAGIAVLFAVVRSRARAAQVPPAALSADEEQRVAALLGDAPAEGEKRP